MIVLPAEWSQRAVENALGGSYTLNHFYAMFLGPGLRSADANEVARATLVASW